MREIIADWLVVGLRARRRSGLSRTRSVLRGAVTVVVEVEEVRVETTLVSVVLRWTRSSDLSV